MKTIAILLASILCVTTAHGQMLLKNSSELEHLRVTPEGRVGIGTTNPARDLEIANDVRIRSLAHTADGDLYVQADDQGDLSVTAMPPNAPHTQSGSWNNVGQTDGISFSFDVASNANYIGEIFCTPVVSGGTSAEEEPVVFYFQFNSGTNQMDIAGYLDIRSDAVLSTGTQNDKPVPVRTSFLFDGSDTIINLTDAGNAFDFDPDQVFLYARRHQEGNQDKVVVLVTFLESTGVGFGAASGIWQIQGFAPAL